MQLFFSIILGYLLGSLSPAALISHIKKQNLKQRGTGNLGTANTLVILGKRYAALVMIGDIAKAWLAVRLAEYLFPLRSLAGLLAGCAAVVGHIFPFYLHFDGGKGVASLLGLALACSPSMGLAVILFGLSMMLITNHGVAWSFSVPISFAILNGFRSESLVIFALSAAISFLVLYKHLPNLQQTSQGQDTPIRSYIAHHLFHHSAE